MRLSISFPSNLVLDSVVSITGSKSETNRMLLLQALYPNLEIKNRSNADDAQLMQAGLEILSGEVDIHHAGTAMRFLTSFFASQSGKQVVLTGSSRMQQRPIGVLVNALRNMGADIQYVNQEGYPPLKIHGTRFTTNQVQLPADISSQYISSLCLVAPSLPDGLEITLEGKITSVPYIKMTLALLEEIGVQTSFTGKTIKIWSKPSVPAKQLTVESDWSAASYYYSIIALSPMGSKIRLSSFKKDSLQGDSVLQDIYNYFGITTSFLDGQMLLEKTAMPKKDKLELDLSNAPDIAQTIAVTCFGLGMPCHLTGLHTLPIKETDRLAAMKAELEKFGARVTIDHESLELSTAASIKQGVVVDTYNDHRMAMAFAPLAVKINFSMNDAEVVSKSYPDFWQDLEQLGFGITEV